MSAATAVRDEHGRFVKKSVNVEAAPEVPAVVVPVLEPVDEVETVQRVTRAEARSLKARGLKQCGKCFDVKNIAQEFYDERMSMCKDCTKRRAHERRNEEHFIPIGATQCARCGQVLSDPASIARGFGPICIDKAE
jgi:hypothetical protein